jgi:hypothetical protein
MLIIARKLCFTLAGHGPLHNDLAGIGGSVEVLERSICPDLYDQHHQSPCARAKLVMHVTLVSFLDDSWARGQSFKIWGNWGKLKSGPDVRCFRRRSVQPITVTSEVVPGAAAEKAKFDSSLVCWLC